MVDIDLSRRNKKPRLLLDAERAKLEEKYQPITLIPLKAP